MYDSETVEFDVDAVIKKLQRALDFRSLDDDVDSLVFDHGLLRITTNITAGLRNFSIYQS